MPKGRASMNARMPELTTLWRDLSELFTFLGGETHILCVKSCVLAQQKEKFFDATCETLSSDGTKG